MRCSSISYCLLFAKRMTERKKRTRSRFGCHRCKRLKVKCDEQRPACDLCVKSGKECDYSIKLQWGGRPFKKPKKNNLAEGTVVVFDQMYNPDKQEETQVPPTQNGALASSTDLTARPLPLLAPELSRDPSSSSVMSVDSICSPKNFDFVHPLDGAATAATDNLIPLEKETFMRAFRELDTHNTVAKQFLNDVLLPELMSMNDLDHRSESDSSPDNLIISENSHIFHTSDTESFNFSSNLDFTGFGSVPGFLMPLPDILLQNPLYREHYHGYVEIYSKLLCPASPRAYTDNPFTCLLPRMSLSAGTDGLLAMLISFSLCQSASFRGEPYPKETVGLLLNKALDDLYRRLTNPLEADSDYTLSLILVLSCFEIICDSQNHDWRSHYLGARKIMFSRGLLRATNSMISQRKRVSFIKGQEADIHYFFTRWFAYLDVIGSLSSSSSVFTSSTSSDIQWECPIPTRADREHLKDIDPLTGFDTRLLECFSMIVSLVTKRESSSQKAASSLSLTLIRDALEGKEFILKYLKETEDERDEIKMQLMNDPLNVLNEQLSDYALLRATNRIFGLSGVLQIYRRVLLMPRDTSLVQDLVKEITQVIRDEIPKDQPAAYCTLFSLFSCGCEAMSEEDQEFYLYRISALATTGSGNLRIAKDVMMEGWATGKYWADILAEKKLDLIFV